MSRNGTGGNDGGGQMTAEETSAGNAIPYVFISVLLVVLASLFLLHLSGVAAETPGQFSVAELDPGNVTIDEQEAVAVSATVENTGETATTQVVTLSLGEEEKREWLTLDPGDTETVQLDEVTGTELGVGDTTAQVRTENEEVTSTVRVESDRPPEFEVRDLQPGDIVDEQTVNVSAVVENTGGNTATQTVALRFDGETRSQRTVTLDPGESERFEVFNVDISWLDGGTYIYGVYSGNHSVTATASVDAPARAQLRNTTVDPVNGTIHTGDQFTVSSEVANAGDLQASGAVSFTVDDTELDSKAFELDGGESTTVVFENVSGDRLGIGRHTYSLSAGETTAEGTLLVEGDTPAHFAVTGLEPGNTSVEQPGSLDISASVENIGQQNATKTVDLSLDGRVAASTTMVLAPGESRQFTVYNLSTAELGHGTYNYSAGTEDDRDTATVDTRG